MADDNKYSPEEIREAQEELDKLKAKSEELTEEDKKRRKELELIIGLMKEQDKYQSKRLDDLKGEIEILERALATDNERYASAERHRALQQIRLERDELMLENIRQKLISQKELTEEEQEAYKAAGGTKEELDKTLSITSDLLAAKRKFNKEIIQGSPLLAKSKKIAADMLVVLDSQHKMQYAINKASAAGDAILTKTFGLMVETMKEAEEVFSDFRRTMQLGDDYETRITQTTQALSAYGVTVKDAAEAQNALIKTTTDFTLMTKNEQDALVHSAALAGELGVAYGDFAQGIQNSTKFFNQGATQAIQTQGELAATARMLGRDQTEFAAQFAKSGHQFAKFGAQGVKAFKDLAHIQKITGMEMEKVLAITNKFDTFEGAAEQAGKLNAALGGNMVNAMDLMMATDPAERFGMIRDSILDAGLTFDDMSYYQKQFYAESLGLSDVSDLALVLAGDMDNLAGAANQSSEEIREQKRRAAEAQSVMDSFKNILVEMGTAALGLYQGLSTLTGGLIENRRVIQVLIGVYGIYKTISIALTLVEMASKAGKILSTAATVTDSQQTALNSAAKTKHTAALAADTTALGANSTALGVNSTALGTNSGAMKKAGKAKAGMGPALIAFGAAILMIGAGVYFAATGMANLAESVSNLDSNELDAFSNSLIFLGVALGTVMAIIVLIGVLASGPQILGIMGVAAAFMMMGVGVALAAAGIGYMAEGFAKMFQHIDLEKVAATAVLFGVLYLGAGLGYAAALGIAAIGLALGGLTLALKFMNFKKLEQVTGFMTAFTDFEVASIYAVTEALSDMAKTIDEMDMKKTIALETVLATTAVVGATMGPALMLPMMVAGAVGGGVTAAMQATAAQPAAGGGGTTTTRTPLIIKLGDTGDTLQKFIIETVGNEVKVVNS